MGVIPVGPGGGRPELCEILGGVGLVLVLVWMDFRV